MIIHKKARFIITKLSLPGPIKKFFSAQKMDIDLSHNTNPYTGEFAPYPDVIQEELKEIYLSRIGSLAHPKTSLALSAENVLFTVGSLEGIDLLIRTFAEPNKEAICIPQPTFPAYEHWGRLHNLRIRKVPLEGDDFTQLPLQKLKKTKSRLTFLCNPNNPVGTSLSLNQIEELCQSTEDFVIVDEAYIEFSRYPSCLPLLSLYPNLIVLRTFSKAWGLAGLRCGAVLAEKSIIATLRRTQLPFGFTTFSQEKIKECLEDPKGTFQTWEKIKLHRDDLLSELQKLDGVSKVFRSEANFLFLTLRNFHHTLAVLEKKGLYVLDCSSVLPNAIRVSLGTAEQNKAFLEALREASSLISSPSF